MEKKYILKQMLFIFFMGLTAQYENVKSQMLYREKVPDLEWGNWDCIGRGESIEACARSTYQSSYCLWWVNKVWINLLKQIQEMGQRTIYGVPTAKSKNTLKTPASNWPIRINNQGECMWQYPKSKKVVRLLQLKGRQQKNYKIKLISLESWKIKSINCKVFWVQLQW